MVSRTTSNLSTQTVSDRPDYRSNVTVVLPCYNSHQFLQQTLDSIRAQTLPPSEIILVDDGSNDPETLAFLDSIDDDVQIIRQENKGLAAARNTGFRHAQYKYILPLDCDDWLEPTFIAEAVPALEHSPELAFVFADMCLEGDRKDVLKKSYNHFEQLFTNQLPYCLLMRRSAWFYVGGYDESMRMGLEDWEFNIRLGGHDLFGKSLGKPLFHYRVSSSGMLKRISLSQFSSLYRIIRKKHEKQYRIGNLLRLWLDWRRSPSAYQMPILIYWLTLHTVLPDRVINKLIRILGYLSHAKRSIRSMMAGG